MKPFTTKTPLAWSSILFLSFGVACAKPAHAEPPKAPVPYALPPPPPSASAQPNAPMPPWRSHLLRDRVGLDEKTAAAVERILAKYRPERRAASEAVEIERRKLDALLELDSNDQAAYARSIRAMLEARQKLIELQKKQTDELGKVLTPKQQAKLARAIGETRETIRRKGPGRGHFHGRGRRGRR